MLAFTLAACAGATSTLGPEPLVAWRHDRLVFEEPSDWRLRGPVGTVCVTGDDRVGKSTLLGLWARNLTNEEFEFPVGHSRSSHTKGLWSAILPDQATGLDFHLNLCDSQGLKQVAELPQWRLFASNVLVPQVLVYMLINVVQTDQLRDLARMAHQFQKLGRSKLLRFGGLSPHLVVLVREESDLDGEGQDGRNLTSHLEQVLQSPGYAEDKALIRQVFQTREAWSLEELPLEARRALREGNFADSAQRWRASGEAALKQVLSALQRKALVLPQGPELWEWYRSVLETVNSEEELSLERLIGHSERLDLVRQRRRLMQDWYGRGLVILAGLAVLSAFSSSISLCVDIAAWLAWVLLSVCFLGASPLLRTPLSGLAQKLCEQFSEGSEVWMKMVCLEVSSQGAAVIIASLLGALSYPLITAQLRCLMGHLPLPAQLSRSFVMLLLLLAALCLSLLQEAAGGTSARSAPQILAACVLATAAISATVDIAQQTLHSHRCAAASAIGRGLHFYIAERDQSVAALEASAEWKQHYRRHARDDAIWRYRLASSWQTWSRLLEACGLLTWSWLIYPQWDVILAVGAIANLADLSFSLLRWLKRCMPGDDVQSWLDSLEDTDSEDAPAEEACKEPQILPETADEARLRMEIEEMRREAWQGSAPRKAKFRPWS
ncbi:unnamed protein product [Effrenium voratum]|nr:unnamed protein product [Effrenium voratum]|mmetsp:Transcript_120095/g.285303  ORF Transcript_120095/g.285303 Transcript_120095/m.285303 type:complete len:665 (-) Transcript_120095:44-2038(-)